MQTSPLPALDDDEWVMENTYWKRWRVLISIVPSEIRPGPPELDELGRPDLGENRRNDAALVGDNKGSDGGPLAGIDRGDEVVAKCQISRAGEWGCRGGRPRA